MRFPLAIGACFGLALVSMTLTGQASAEPQSGSRLLVFDGRSTQASTEADRGVRILRGSAIKPRSVPDRYDDAMLGPGRWQAVAGERFWLFDRQSRKLASCRNIGTANVGEREIECTFGTFSRYRRTFGNNFRH